MRRKTQKEIVQIIETLQEAHTAIVHMYKVGNTQEALKLLVQCQECAIQIGDIIEEKEGHGTKAVSCLELYCERLYEISQISDLAKLSNGKWDLDKILLQARHEVEENISLMLKVVFMPYKASMWDCMESIWEAARSDPKCEVQVVPIPYYERDKTGKLDKFCCERNLFPQYVPVTSYEEFSLKEELPDVIYIHNPYDDVNLVTTVHPDYYSKQLKKYTEMLVYVPYYITSGNMPESHGNLPVYYNADKIILQNVQMAKGIHRDVPKERLAVLGNPKTDKILRLCENPPEIPEQWKSVIFRDNGEKKKVVMYNCSLTGLLQNTDRFFRKMEFLFRIVKMKQERVSAKGIILLWRPHPLLEATLASMRPEWQMRFESIKKEFLEGGIGIYDETPDPAESIALCDAYMGESSSSIVVMFGVAGKPIFILDLDIAQEEELVTEEEMRAMSFVDMVIDGEIAWFVSNRYQAVCKMDMHTGEAWVVARIPGTERGLINHYGRIYKKENKLYLVPLHTDSLCIYDIENHTFSKIYFPDARFDNFCDILFYQNEIIFVPSGYGGIVRFNEHTGAYKRIDGFISEYEKLCNFYDETLPRFFGGNLHKGDVFWLACAQCNCVLRYDLKDDSWLYYEVGDKNNTYRDVVCEGDELWLLPYVGKSIVKWNSKSNEHEEYSQYLDKIKVSDIENVKLFRGWYQNDKTLYAIPVHADSIIKVNIDTGEINVQDTGLDIDIGERKFEHWKGWANYDFYKEYGNYLVLKLSYDESILFINKCNMQLECRKPVRLALQELIRLQGIELKADTKGRNGYFGLTENIDFNSLPVFMDQLGEGYFSKCHEQRRYYSGVIKNMDGSAGNIIYEYIKVESLKR